MEKRDNKLSNGTCHPPVAGACVESQKDLETYDLLLGINRGTIFPLLDLPWEKEINKGPLSSCLLHQLMAVDFALKDWILFLDTHPRNKYAKEVCAKLRTKRHELANQYQKKYGPLTAAEDPGEAWLESPWPWQKDFEKSRCC